MTKVTDNCALLVISKLKEHDGGCIYAKKNVEYFFSSHCTYELMVGNNFFAHLNRIYFGRLFQLICRLPYMAILKNFLMNRLATHNARHYCRNNDTSKLGTIIAVTGDLLSMQVAKEISKLTNIKVHLITMDLPWTFKNSQINNKYIKYEFKKTLPFIHSAEFTTSKMKKIAEKLGFSGNSFISYSGIDLALKNTGVRQNKILKSKLRCVYAGTPRFKKELKIFYDLMSLKTDYDFDINIFSGFRFYEASFKFHDFLSDQEQLIKRLSHYDVGIIPMSFDKNDAELVSTSFPSKLYAYLLAGLPVIVIAPEHSALAKLVKKYNLGEVFDINCPEKLNLVLNNLGINSYRNSAINFAELIRNRFINFRKILLLK